MKMNKKYIFNHFFKDEAKELEEKNKMIKFLKETLNSKKIELKIATERANKFIEENTRLRVENGELWEKYKKSKENIINSKEYKTLLEKYNELKNKNLK